VSPSTDQETADAASRVAVVSTPSTDTATGNPTGGPIAGADAPQAAREKHGLLDRLESDLRAELRFVEALPEHVLHILNAVFGRHHSAVDTE